MIHIIVGWHNMMSISTQRAIGRKCLQTDRRISSRDSQAAPSPKINRANIGRLLTINILPASRTAKYAVWVLSLCKQSFFLISNFEALQGKRDDRSREGGTYTVVASTLIFFFFCHRLSEMFDLFIICAWWHHCSMRCTLMFRDGS